MSDWNWGRIGEGFATGGLSELGGLRTAGDAVGGKDGKKSAPAPPDFMALADKQTLNNRPNQITPFSQTMWSTGPDGRPVQTTSASEGLAGTLGSMEQQAGSAWSSPLDNGAQARDRAEQAIYGRATARLDPQWSQRESAAKAELANAGLDLGGEASTKALDDLGRQRNDAYQSALMDAIMGGGTEAQRQQNMDLTSRMAPLEGLASLKALMTAPAYGSAGDYMGAGRLGYQGAMEQYDANGGALGGTGQLLQALGPLIGLYARSQGGGK